MLEPGTHSINANRNDFPVNPTNCYIAEVSLEIIIMTDYYHSGLEILCKHRESPLPLTDPHDTQAQHMLNIPYHIIW